MKFSLTNENGAKVCENTKQQFELFVTKDELFDGMMTLKPHKCPGIDGLGLAFYRKFWKILVDPLYNMLLQAYEEGALSFSAKRGVINLIPKKNSDEKMVKGWRLITLLCYDYKIYAKALSNRMDTVISDLVPKEQTGFIKGRSIHSNLHKTREVISYLNEKGKPGVIALIDFSKCFDRISYDSIKGVFNYLNYGKNFIQMLMLLYNDFDVCTQNNGHTSQYLKKDRGVNQGCPASPAVYVQTSAVILHLINANKDIKGIPMYGLEQLLSLFADDTSAFLSYDPLVINAFCNVLEKVEQQLGLQVSYEKTCLYRVGSLHNSNAQCYTVKPLKWSDGPLETLGIVMNCDGTTNSENFQKIMQKMNQVCNNWATRQATLIGKVLLINTLMASLFVYSSTVMVDLSDEQVKMVQHRIHKFLWNGRERGRIAMRTLCKSKADGGLRLVDIRAKQEAIKIQCIFTYDQQLLSMCYQQLNVEDLGDLVWKCNINETDVKKLFDTDRFSAQIMQAWAKVNFLRPQGKTQVENQIIWLNSMIWIENKPIYWKKWIQKGIILISDLLTNGHFKNWADVAGNDANLQWIQYAALLAAIPVDWKRQLKDDLYGEGHTPLYDQLSKTRKATRPVYDMLIKDSKTAGVLNKYKESWKLSGLYELNYREYTDCFSKLYVFIKPAKYQDFQYRLLLNKLVFNDDLYRWGKRDSDFCTFCNLHSEMVKHILWECSTVYDFWMGLKSKSADLSITFENVILNKIHKQAGNIFNYVCVIAKQYIYRCRCNKKLPVKIWEEIELVQQSEFYAHKIRGNLSKHIRFWSYYKPELERINSNLC